jgi:Histidine kinase-, DNA gyrase B-, and HSP90-like ATPase
MQLDWLGERRLMSADTSTVGGNLDAFGQPREQIEVRLSKEIITLLSEQLYQSPSKAIEELVVNSFDADATACHVMVPLVSIGTDVGRLPLIAVYDNGVGMDLAGLTDLWRIGASNKRETQIQKIRKRTQIGKFGIGKLATYSLANRITYLTSTGKNEILALSLTFTEFHSDPAGPDRPVELEVRALSLSEVLGISMVVDAIKACGLEPSEALSPAQSWTLALLEELKDRAAKLSPGRLKWVLRTAMPLSIDFKLYLNGDQITSSKEDYELITEFTLGDLPKDRLRSLAQKTGKDWTVEQRPVPEYRREKAGDVERALICKGSFDEGVFGRVIVTDRSLFGKSADIVRSHGFFIHVRGRLINEDDPLFGVTPREHRVFNSFHADIDADDLDKDLTAPREGIGLSDHRDMMIDVLTEVFNEARTRSVKILEDRRKRAQNKREDDRNYVDPRNVERPVADVLTRETDEGNGQGSEADETWFYLEPPGRDEREEVVERLYKTEQREEPYKYDLDNPGPGERMVRFAPGERKFIINEDHELVLAFIDDDRARQLLYDVVTAEALLEVYLREVGLPAHLVGEVLERRDGLWRSLARDQVVSPRAIAASLRNSVASERDLEIGLVVAARALGFVAKHMSGATNPDGLARLRDYPAGEKKITLEAKSSATVPSLGAIDFGGLAQHVKDTRAQGCLLVAPDYPGKERGDFAAAAKRAEDLHISCWTVEQLARVVEAMESRYITARQILDIVLTAFSPEKATEKINLLLQEPAHPPREIVRGVVAALFSLEIYGPGDRLRSIDMMMPELKRAGLDVPTRDVRSAVRALAAASQGALTMVSEDRFRLNTSVEELERRVAPMTGGSSSARRGSTFRAEPRKPETS